MQDKLPILYRDLIPTKYLNPVGLLHPFCNSLITKLLYEYKSSYTYQSECKHKVIMHLILSNLAINPDWIYLSLSNPIISNQHDTRDPRGINQEIPNHKISRDYLRGVLEFLNKNNYIEVKKHYFDGPESKKNRLTSIKLTKKLKNLIKTFDWWFELNVKKKFTDEIVIRDKQKIEFTISKTNRFLNKRKVILDEYCTILSKCKIRTDSRRLDHIHFKCVFNNTIRKGGRIYHNIYSLTKEERKTITFDNEETTELDFVSIHILLLYNRVKKNPKMKNVYSIKGFPREYCKLALLILINAKNENEAINSICNKIYKNTIFQERINFSKWRRELREQIVLLISLIKKKHSFISQFFCSNSSLELMLEDSNILFECMEKINKKQIPYLTVHDSIIISTKKVDFLRRTMLESIQDILVIDPPFELIS